MKRWNPGIRIVFFFVISVAVYGLLTALTLFVLRPEPAQENVGGMSESVNGDALDDGLLPEKQIRYISVGNDRLDRYEYDSDGTFTGRYELWEYDGEGRIVHKIVYDGKQKSKESYYSYRNEMCACITYTYENADGGGERLALCEKSVSDAQGNLLLNDICDAEGTILSTKRYQYNDQAHPVLIRKGENGECLNEVWALAWSGPLHDQKEADVSYYKADSFAEAAAPYWYQKKEPDMRYRLFYWYAGEHVASVMKYGGSGLEYYSACDYDENGNLQEITEYTVDTMPDSLHQTRYTYDESGRPVLEEYFSVRTLQFGQLRGYSKVVFERQKDGALTSLITERLTGNAKECITFEENRFRRWSLGNGSCEGEQAVLQKLSIMEKTNGSDRD